MIVPIEYLTSKDIRFTTRGHEIVFKCPFGNCDTDTKHAGHCYMNAENGTYCCQKCGEKGNLVTLTKFFGDDPFKVGVVESNASASVTRYPPKSRKETLTHDNVDAWHQALPQHIREWLHKDRGLSDQVISQAKLGWDGERVTIPVVDHAGALLFAKRRVAPGQEAAGPKYLYPKGTRAALYGVELLPNADHVVLAEGELDALVLRTHGVMGASTTGGAGTFSEDWLKLFLHIPQVYIAYDNDEAGKVGALKIGRLIPHAKIITLPPEVGKGGDLTDFFVKLGKNVDDLYQLMKQSKTAKEIDEEGARYVPLPPPDTQTSITEWRDSVRNHFPECLSAAEVGFSILAQLLIKDVRNPFGLVLLDVPSAGKTITLNFFSELDELVYTTDNFTPAALVSHATNRKQEDLEKIDLLPRIRHRLLIVRDLAPIFAERQENLLKNLGVLTRVFDGEGYESESGVHGRRGYRGDYTFMFLAGSTPIAPRVWKFMGNLGSRLFFLNLNVSDKTEEELADLLIQDDFKKKEEACRRATRNAVLSLWNRHVGGIVWDKKKDAVNLRQIIARCAKLLAHLRAPVNVWSENEDGGKEHHHTNVVIEKPTRLNQLLYNLARGHALACGRTQLESEDMWLVIETTFHSAQYNRIKLLNAVIDNDGTVTTGYVESAMNCSNPTALKEIETLRILEIVQAQDVETTTPGRPEKIVTLRNEFDWFCSDECKQLRAMKPE